MKARKVYFDLIKDNTKQKEEENKQNNNLKTSPDRKGGMNIYIY
jgi:hypothetical protein